MKRKSLQSLIWVLTAVVCLSSSLKPAEAAEATDQTSEEIQRWKDPLHDHEKSRGLGVSLDQAFHVNDHLLISPDIQVIRNPVGLAGADTITILGVRTQVLL